MRSHIHSLKLRGVILARRPRFEEVINRNIFREREIIDRTRPIVIRAARLAEMAMTTVTIIDLSAIKSAALKASKPHDQEESEMSAAQYLI